MKSAVTFVDVTALDVDLLLLVVNNVIFALEVFTIAVDLALVVMVLEGERKRSRDRRTPVVFSAGVGTPLPGLEGGVVLWDLARLRVREVEDRSYTGVGGYTARVVAKRGRKGG
ncbi:hypothetical protein BDV96DRAFT_597819 [Lophiotrema nucula]|uniref:Uncharacterized protein n=1 Tax=Lophiotrema nucula TaxID=690887 RepID=A0A6A5ZEQ8_9PLEO|nr:hypothetical protein BDV96DRAFT_597819 [Lophiotrema nucula]